MIRLHPVQYPIFRAQLILFRNGHRTALARQIFPHHPALYSPTVLTLGLVSIFPQPGSTLGTNDLTQYTLAIDRQNPKLDDFYDAHHPAVLEMIRMVAQNAHAEGIWAGICGELGADLELTEQFLQMGIDELSVSPGRILPIRKIVRESECGCE